MAIAAGTRFNHYEILALLGAGGMGEVYRARDTHLNREVAIKVLPADFAKDVERLRRFEQEAHATSALNHPNILTVHDIGNHGGAPYIVAELLEGEELRAHLDHGALSIRKAIDYAQQIATGLAAAHEKGMVHRDLKPENLFVTKDGRVKILDFGLAKLRPQKLNGGVDSEAPTLKPLTNPGVVMGTIGYMSPEQVRGQEADHRSDIFSFGLILYEMLSGRRAFSGTSVADVMSAILKEEPPELSETNAKISPALVKLVRRCLEKKPERRFHSAHDLGFALEALSLPSSSGANRTEAVQALDTSAITKPIGWRNYRIWMLAAGVMTLIAALALGVVYVRRPSLEAEPMRLSINPPERAKVFTSPTISPDGRTLAFVAEVDGKRQLWVRPLGAMTARPLVELRGGGTPFWSTDSRFIAYYEQGKLKKLALAGGAPETLCDTVNQDYGTWNRDGVILFGTGNGGIRRVSAYGGSVTNVTNVDTARGDTAHFAPTFLPDGRHFLYHNSNPDPQKHGLYLASLTGGESRKLLSVDIRNVGVALNPVDERTGYLTFVQQGTLFAQPFDFRQNQLVGEPVRIVEQVPGVLYANYSLAANGVLVLMERETDQQLTWFNRAGEKLGTLGPTGRYSGPRLSADGQRLAVVMMTPQSPDGDIYLFELAGGAGLRFTFDPKEDSVPLWSPDGRRLVWTSRQIGGMNLFQKAASGAGQDEVLLRTAYRKVANDWSTDGRFILYGELNPQTSDDLWVLPLEGERKPWPWLNMPAGEYNGKFSPDGKWIAYNSNESGRDEIYLQAFLPGAPAAGGRRQLSTNGGTNLQWRRDGREVYYLTAERKLMAVEITPGAELKAGTPKELFTPSGYRSSRTYTLTGDEQRFLFVTSAEDASVTPFTVVLNWMAEVQR